MRDGEKTSTGTANPLVGRTVDRVTGMTVWWEVSLDDFASGKAGDEGFRGRPLLLLRMRPAIEQLYCTKAVGTARAELSQLRRFWLFLDYLEDVSRSTTEVGAVQIDDLDWLDVEALWPTYVRWVGEQPGASSGRFIRTARNVFEAAHEVAIAAGRTRHPSLLLQNPVTRGKAAAYGDDPLNYEEGAQLFRALLRRWRVVVKVIEDGRRMALAGVDPMVGSGGANKLGGTWDRIENRLWLIMRTTPFGALEQTRGRPETLRNGFKERAPGRALFLRASQATGMWAHVDSVFLTTYAVAVALAIVSIKSGLNPDTLSRLLVENWCYPDPLRPETHVVIFGPKRMRGKTARCVSGIKRLADPYKVIQKVIDLTAGLRARAIEVAKATGNRKLARQALLVWIWPSSRGIADALPESNRDGLHEAIDRIIEEDGLRRADGTLMHFRLGDARSIWAEFVYRRSGRNALLTAKALGHVDVRTLLFYTETRQAKRLDRTRLVELQGMVFSGLRNGTYEPKTFRRGPHPRSALGLSCGDPTSPAPEADPGHRPGQTCLAQQCWLCHQWYLTIEGLPYVCRVVADLEAVRETMSLGLWETSGYADALHLFRYILSRFDLTHVAKARVAAERLPPIVTPALSARR